ncbi:hypothetical protein FJ251_05500 [bacterium]|nr:hypothetical protein [bacterium]
MSLRLVHPLPRICLPLLLHISLLVATSLPAAAAQVEWTWQAEPALRALANGEDLATLLAGRAWQTEAADQPALPLYPLSLAIPSGERVVSVRLEPVLSDRIALAAPLPAPAAILGENGPQRGAPSQPAADFVHSFATASYRGFASAEIAVAPLRYTVTAAGPELERLLAARVSVVTEPDPGAVLPLRQRAEELAQASERLRARAANKADVARFAPASAPRRDEGIFAPRSLPSLEGSGVDMVIVCAPEHAAIFQPLADFKLSLGIPTVVRDTDWIRANYPQGADLQETIRFFLQDALAKWGIRFVMIAADTDFVPVRFVHSYFKDPPEDIPAELYYAQLDGTWNGDGDQHFGESNYAGAQGDAADMIADVFLGRLPVRDAQDAQLMVDKIIAYSSAPDPQYTTNMSFYAEVLFPADWQIGDPVELITRNGADYAEDVNDTFVTPQMDVLRLYETHWLYPGTQPESPTAALNDLGTRAHVVLHVGHGFRYTMSMGTGPVVANDMFALTNGLDHLSFIYALNCTSCAIDYNCLGESALLAPAGGSIAVVGTMREAFPNTSVYYQNSFFGYLFGDSLSLGECFTRSHNDWYLLATVEGSHRWTQMSYVLIGDPSVDVWLQEPQTLSTALVEPYTLSSSLLKLQVNRGGQPLAGVRVIADKAGEHRGEGITDANGRVDIPFHAETLGFIKTSALSRNDLPGFGQVNVGAASGPRLAVELLAVVDDPNLNAQVVGNADGLLDAGETVRLNLRVRNRGSAPASALTLDISLPGGELSVLQGQVISGQSVPAGGQIDLPASFLLAAPLSLADRRNLLVDFALSYTGGAEQDQLDIVSHAPLPRLFAFKIDDAAGDGDGQPDAGETYTLLPEWKNYGSTPLAGWTASLSAIDPDGQVLSGPVALPAIGLLGRGSSAGISLLETSVASPNRFALTLSGPFGQAVLDTITVRRPSAPLFLMLDSSQASTVIDASWPIPTPAPAGYLVYRGTAPGGPYALVSTEPTRYAYFRNEQLEESTTYYFIVESVDSSGFRSAPTAEFPWSTNPAMLEGWPLQTNFGTASSAVIGDIDGDGDKEIAVGAELLYAWHHDGVEIADGDGNSSTYGALSPNGGQFTAGLAMADVDTLYPGLEIIGASRAPNGLYVYHGDGSLVTGWPRSLPNWCWATPAVADVDGDQLAEIFAVCIDGTLRAYNWDGTAQIGSTGIFASGLGTWSRSSPSLANIDADADLEIILGSGGARRLYAFNPNGTAVPGFPVLLGAEIHSSPSIGDLDGNYDMEIVFLCENDSLYVFNHNGTRYPGFPVFLASNAAGLAPSPALVDFEQDGQMEIVAAGVYAYHSMDLTVLSSTGVPRPGWPKHFEESSEGSPVVLDVDGDDELEILLGMESGFLFAFNEDGSDVAGFPILTDAELRSCPTGDDLDGDLDLDVALYGWDAFCYVWDMNVFYKNGLAQWKMFRANPARTGVFTPEEQIVASEELPTDAPAGRLFANFPNPFNPSTKISFATPAGQGSVQVTLTIHDVLGRRLATLQDGALPRGSAHSVIWDGKSESGKPVPSGVYFARVAMDEHLHSRKMVLLK